MRLSNAVVDSLCVVARVLCGAETVRTYVHMYIHTFMFTYKRAHVQLYFLFFTENDFFCPLIFLIFFWCIKYFSYSNLFDLFLINLHTKSSIKYHLLLSCFLCFIIQVMSADDFSRIQKVLLTFSQNDYRVR